MSTPRPSSAATAIASSFSTSKTAPRTPPTSHAADATAEHFTELGKGNIPWPALLRQARRQGIRYVFIDQDKTEMPALESVRQSFAYPRKLNL